MAYSQKDLDNIEEAIATGAKRVRINGKEVEYEDLDAKIRIRNLILSDLGKRPSSERRRFAVFKRGL